MQVHLHRNLVKLKKIVLITFGLYYLILMMVISPFSNNEFGEVSIGQEQHLRSHNPHNSENTKICVVFQKEETDFDQSLSQPNIPLIQKLIFLFKSENPKHTCFAYYLDKSIIPFHQDIYILDGVFRI